MSDPRPLTAQTLDTTNICSHYPTKSSSPTSSQSIICHEKDHEEVSEGMLQAQAIPRAHVFLGQPMPLAREIIFFLVVATANFTPSKSQIL